VPSVGERLQVDGLDLEILQADDRRVRSVRVRRADPGGHASEAR